MTDHLALPATLGGPGYRPRVADHRAEVCAGRLWCRAGANSEVAPLRAVALCRPPASIASVTDPDAALLMGPVDLDRLHQQAVAVASAYRAAGVTVSWLDEPAAPPNLLFLRDSFFMTPHGAIVGRMASAQRAGEERLVAAFLAAHGIPIVATVTTGTFEGADALWLSPHRVLIGVGKRTDRAGAAAVARALAAQSIQVERVALDGPVQHLLGAVNLADRDLAVVDERALTADMERALARLRLIRLPGDHEVAGRRAMNFVALAPGRVLMPAGCPRTWARLVAGGVAVTEVAVDEYVNAAGGLGCLTGILHRSEVI